MTALGVPPNAPVLVAAEFGKNWQIDPITSVTYPPWIAPPVPTRDLPPHHTGPDPDGNFEKQCKPITPRPGVRTKHVAVYVQACEIGIIAGASYRCPDGTLVDFTFSKEDRESFARNLDYDVQKRYLIWSDPVAPRVGTIVLSDAEEIDVIASNIYLRLHAPTWYGYQWQSAPGLAWDQEPGADGFEMQDFDIFLEEEIKIIVRECKQEAFPLDEGEIAHIHFLEQGAVVGA